MKFDLQSSRERRIVEIMLISVALGLTALFYLMNEQGMVILNLFCLPVLICGYYLGRNSAGILALLCALVVTIVTASNSMEFSGYTTPVMVGLALTVWAASLGLTGLLVGTLCDERNRTVNELHKAYVGVVEVLSKYLQSADPNRKARSTRVAELSLAVASKMGLNRKELDDIRVAALLYDLENVEITTEFISKAVTTLDSRNDASRHTFLGTDLAHSLGAVLEGSLPLIACQKASVRASLEFGGHGTGSVPIGARIISAVRAYDALTDTEIGGPALDPVTALHRLKEEGEEYYRGVINVIEEVVCRQADCNKELARV